jgi:Flp pilus assembly secretin CpaC
MDIPFVGELFKTTYTEERDTDLVVVVTPFIVALQDSPSLPGASGATSPTEPLPAKSPNAGEPGNP